jgi:hypothetical protein
MLSRRRSINDASLYTLTSHALLQLCLVKSVSFELVMDCGEDALRDQLLDQEPSREDVVSHSAACSCIAGFTVSTAVDDHAMLQSRQLQLYGSIQPSMHLFTSALLSTPMCINRHLTPAVA